MEVIAAENHFVLKPLGEEGDGANLFICRR